MRIVAGALKGRRLSGPRAPGLRPTSEGLRETLFNILGTAVPGASVLDGFAGTGAIGLEAISRGAARVTFVETDRHALALLRENIRRCGVDAECTVVARDVLRAAPELGNAFDVVVLDPPYDVKDLGAVLNAAARVVAPGGRLVLEHSRRREAPAEAPPLQRTRVVIAGDSALSFYR